MQEDLLQFIWKYNLYRPGALTTTTGEPIQVTHPGTLNRDAGPDFSMARIRIGSTILAGNIELHIRTSDWLRHHHDSDPVYSRVILHVVYEHDMEALPGNIPVLQLKEHIPAEVLDRYTHLIQTTASLPCSGVLHKATDIVKSSWMSRMLVERWEQKLELKKKEMYQDVKDWNTLFYQQLASNFGFKINATPFTLLAQSLPLNILNKQGSLLQVEALLFGQAGMLDGTFTDAYPQQLQQEYHYLRQKYSLSPITAHLWKFLRLRPANFPPVRIAQFAALIYAVPQLFTTLRSQQDIRSLTAKLSVTASEYWNTHYRFDHPQQRSTVKSLGTDAIQNIIINTIAPMQFLYAHEHGAEQDAERALQMLDALPAEDNKIIRIWTSNGWHPEHAGHSQSLVQLYNNYCSSKRCLECAVGLSIIRTRPDK